MYEDLGEEIISKLREILIRIEELIRRKDGQELSDPPGPGD